MATYHGLFKVTCIKCEWVTTDDHMMERLNDMDGLCPECEEQFFKWENIDGSIVVSYTDENGNYDNLVFKGEGENK